MNKAHMVQMGRPNSQGRPIYTCANCPGEITAADNLNNGLITLNIDGRAKSAHRTCPTPRPAPPTNPPSQD